ncbi:DNA repair protein RecO [Thalassotalea ganghwensis]
MNESLQAAYLLHHRPYKENQLLVEFITEHSGKVAAVTFISHSAKSDRKSLLQPFRPLIVSFSGHHSLRKLTLVESDGRSLPLKKDSLYSAFYLNELLVKLLPELAPCPELFALYHHSIHSLVQGVDLEKILRQFERMLLDELGESIDFSSLLASQGQEVQYIPNLGFVEANKQYHYPIYQVIDIQAIADGNIVTQQTRRAYKLLMRQVIEHILGDKTLHSRKLFKRG